MNRVSEYSPAKINLFLAVAGPRADGYHDLVSLAAPLAWGDRLTAEPAAEFSLTCDDPAVPVDGTNLVLKAAAAFRRASGWTGGARFTLEKRIPVGAGLGGGSSNAVAALRALNRISDGRLEEDRWGAVAAELGSDCSLFLHGGPAWLRGRGERVEPLETATGSRLRGRRVFLLKPGFSISTAWAYGRMRGDPRYYLPAAVAEARVAAWCQQPGAAAEALLYNNMEGPAFEKFPALPLLLEYLRQEFGLEGRLSGSGSACFALRPAAGGPEEAEIAAAVRSRWGASALVVETHLA